MLLVVAGGLRGRGARKYGDAEEQQQNIQVAEASNEELADNYNKVFPHALKVKAIQ